MRAKSRVFDRFPVSVAPSWAQNPRDLAIKAMLDKPKPQERISILRSPGFVYFIQGVDGGLVKIGWSSDPALRLAKLQMAGPVILRILHTEAGFGPDEAALHERFKDARRHGEWFEPVPELMAYIEHRSAIARCA